MVWRLDLHRCSLHTVLHAVWCFVSDTLVSIGYPVAVGVPGWLVVGDESNRSPVNEHRIIEIYG